MSIPITAQLFDAAGRALVGATVQVALFDVKGARVCGSGVSDANGRVKLDATDSGFGTVLPRLQLRLMRDKDAVALTEIPASSDGGRLDFGALTVADTAVLQVGGTGYFATLYDAPGRIKPSPPVIAPPPSIARPPTIPAVTPALTKIQVGDLVSGAGVQLTRAQTTLKSADSQFRLGNVSMQLKMVPSDDGTALQFPPHDMLGAGTQLSSLLVDFHAVAPVAGPPSIVVPNLVGYTEALARRKLAELGLRAEVTRQTVPAAERPSRVGRVVEQQPAAGGAAATQSAVTLAIGIALGS